MLLLALPAYAQQADLSGDPAPGTITVRLNGRFRAFAGYWDDSQFNQTSPAGTNKQSSEGLTEVLRLYPGFDGLSAGGLRYGFNGEIRQDNLAAPGGGANGTVDVANASRGSVYVRRDWGYVGTDTLGTLRFGTEDGAASLFLTGTFENFNDGGWNGDAYLGLVQNAQLVWPFADANNVTPTGRLVYLSPRWRGLDFGLSWEPSTAGASIEDGNCPAAATTPPPGAAGGGIIAAGYGPLGCDRLSSTSVAEESARRRNTFDAILRYRAVMGPVGMVATAGYIGGGHVSYSGPGFVPAAGGGVTRAVTYDGLSVVDLGIAFTYAGIQFGGHYMGGRFNNSLANGAGAALALAPAGAKGGDAWLLGASYALGPVVFGGAWVDVNSAGAYAYASTPAPRAASKTPGLGERLEQGVQAGGTLKVSPGLGVFVSYLWDQRRQDGYDFVTGVTGDDLNNRVRAQAVTLGTSLTW